MSTTTQTRCTVSTTRFQPVFGSILAMAIGLEQFRWLKLSAVLIAVGGALLMSASDLSSGGSATGLLVLLAGALSMSVFYIL
jgi:drug/metabolite transporter (DMT)-like permease